VGLPDGEEIMTFFVLSIPACDRRTERHVALVKTRTSIASCG